ncbi:hypothetical protein [Halodesulfovibrio sp. MK-HDV]|jgi:hypothetical protein|uniref:hypothetical protein n=1 Tax=Halodesulfovibrio sp. MK-HDV TaxID=2599925 RepID=UPI00136BD5EE|nr:hypothetical protein [Halodesulfovibrio sp. MK-HDV]
MPTLPKEYSELQFEDRRQPLVLACHLSKRNIQQVVAPSKHSRYTIKAGMELSSQDRYFQRT